ncbi:unnamed protein product [Schistosoma rodhaini]|uniref:Uncharacterized protein n=1 Tax=Schistosoma rodhaini TaxID=6188 RepID=A0AA85EYU8_9TREM|nr:unnamed protein product [Schistosoma rodhaini]CAH8662257.1 unnamed protein product [Schistosoma rodhaini]
MSNIAATDYTNSVYSANVDSLPSTAFLQIVSTHFICNAAVDVFAILSRFPKKLGSIKHHGSGDNIIHRNNNNKNSISPNPDTLPNSSFTRTISDPETAMQQKRQRTLEAKFMQMLHHDNIGSGTFEK